MSRYKIGRGHHIIPLGKSGFAYCYRCTVVCLKNKTTAVYFRKPCRNGAGWEANE